MRTHNNKTSSNFHATEQCHNSVPVICPLANSTVCSHRSGLSLDSIHSILYVSCEFGSMIRIDIDTDEITKCDTYEYCNLPFGVVVDITNMNTSHMVYAYCTDDPRFCSITSIDTNRAGSVTKLVTFEKAKCDYPRDMYVNATTNIIYIACPDAGILKWDGNNNQLTTFATEQQCPRAQSVTVDASHDMLYASCDFDDTYFGGIISMNMYT